MAWALVQQAGLQNLAGGTTITLSFAGAVTAGNMIVVGVVQWNALADVLTVSDNKGNVYTAAGAPAAFAGAGIAAIYRAIATTGGSSFSVTFSVATSGYLTLMIGEFSFTPGSTISVEGYSTGGGSGVAFGDSGLITPVTSGDLVIGVVNATSIPVATAGSGFTLPTEWVLPNPSGEPGLMEYMLSASGPLNATCAFGGSPSWAMAGAAFKATAGGSGAAVGGAALMMGM